MHQRMVSVDGHWTLEGILLDRGGGARPYLRLTGPGPVRYCRSVVELQRYVDLGSLTDAGG